MSFAEYLLGRKRKGKPSVAIDKVRRIKKPVVAME
tara:strand:+ start:33 stop:137 length:105 start_codon:yes stop_codon:yes gene_type:complete